LPVGADRCAGMVRRTVAVKTAAKTSKAGDVITRGSADHTKNAEDSQHVLSLDDLRESLPFGAWRRCTQDYHARFTADVVLSWVHDEEGRGQGKVSRVAVSQRARVGGWHGGDPMTTGGTVWDSALLMALFFQDFPSKLAGQHVVELGSGTGLAGLLARRFGAPEVVLTDLPSMKSLLEENVQRNFPGDSQHISVKPLVWQEVSRTAWLQGGHSFDLVLMSDLLYNESAVEPLLAVLEGLVATKSSPGPLRGYWAQEQHRPEVVERVRQGLLAQGWQLELLRTVEDGYGPDLTLSELTAPEHAAPAVHEAASPVEAG